LGKDGFFIERQKTMAKSEGGAAGQISMPKPLAKVLLLGGANMPHLPEAPAPDEAVVRFLQAHACRCCGICAGGSERGAFDAATETAASRIKEFGIGLAAFYDVPQERLADVFSAFKEVKHIGAGQTRAAAARPEILFLNGVRLGFLFLSEQDGAGGYACEADFWGDGVFDAVRMLLPQCDHVIVFYRAGLPGMDLPLPELRARCRRLADAGASVVCSVSQDARMGWEEYAQGLIVYGLGVFTDSQDTADGSLAVSVDFERNGKFSYEARLLETQEGVLRFSQSDPLKARVNTQNALLANETAYLAEADRLCLARYESGEDELPGVRARGHKRGGISELMRKKATPAQEEERLQGLLSSPSLRQMTLRALRAEQKAGK